MATKYFELITVHYQQRCHRLDVVFDHYWQLSIKASEQQKRGEASALEVRIHGASTPVPKQFPKYISNATNKVSRSAFLTEAWIEMARQRLPADKDLVIGGGATDGKLALSIKNGSAPKLQHCNIVITKKLTSECYCTPNMPVEMHRGLSFNPPILMCYCSVSPTMTTVVSHWGEGSLTLHPSPQDCSWCWTTDVQLEGLPAFHALTGCDSTSALSRVGKKKAWKIIVNSKVHQQHLVCGTIS